MAKTFVKSLLDNATSLPWYWDSTMGGIRVDDHYVVSSLGWTGHEPKPDEALIVYAVNHLPAYEAAVDALESLIEGIGVVLVEDEAIEWIKPRRNKARDVLRRLRDEVPA